MKRNIAIFAVIVFVAIMAMSGTSWAQSEPSFTVKTLACEPSEGAPGGQGDKIAIDRQILLYNSANPDQCGDVWPPGGTQTFDTNDSFWGECYLDDVFSYNATYDNWRWNLDYRITVDVNIDGSWQRMWTGSGNTYGGAPYEPASICFVFDYDPGTDAIPYPSCAGYEWRVRVRFEDKYDSDARIYTEYAEWTYTDIDDPVVTDNGWRYENGKLVVNATGSDVCLQSMWLNYEVNGGNDVDTPPVTVSGPSQTEDLIGPSLSPGDQFRYRVYARDSEGNDRRTSWNEDEIDDSSPPMIAYVTASDTPGDNDGVLESTDTIRIRFRLTDDSGIGSVAICGFTDNVVDEGGGYYYRDFPPPHEIGNNSCTIDYCDADDTPTCDTYDLPYSVAPGYYTASVATVPSGMDVLVNGTTMTSPAIAQVQDGSTLVVEILSPQSAGAGERLVFDQWQDGTTNNPYTMTVGSNVSLTADLQTEYELQVATDPAGIFEIPGAGWYPTGEVAGLVAPTEAGGLGFTEWYRDGVPAGSNPLLDVPMDEPHVAVAYYEYIPTTELRIIAENIIVSPSGDATVQVEIVDVVDLYGFQLDLVFDPAQVSVTAVTREPFIGDELQSEVFWIGPTVDNGSGVVQAAASRLTPGVGVTGTGVLITVDLAIAPGLAAGTEIVIDFDPAEVALSDPNSAEIPTRNLAPVTLMVAPPTPVLTFLTPNIVAVGSGDLPLAVDGTGFVATSIVHWNGTALPTTEFVSSTRLTTTVPANLLEIAGTAGVTVVTPAPGGGPSNALVFTITALNPAWTDIATGVFTESENTNGVTLVDFNTDGSPDPAWASSVGDPCRLFRNVDGTLFEEVFVAPLNQDTNAASMVWGATDLDMYPDLYVSNFLSDNLLLENIGSGLVDITSTLLYGPDSSTRGAYWVDFDTDGRLDLHLLVFGGQDRLYQSDRNGGFTEVSPGGLAVSGNSVVASWADADNDGDPDCYVTLREQPNVLIRNDGGGVFVDVTPPLLADPGYGQGVSWADYDNDGWLDLYVCNRDGGNKLFHNDGQTPGDLEFSEVGGPASDTGLGQSGVWLDYDLDGDSDLFVTNMNSPNLLFRNDGDNNFVNIADGDLAGNGPSLGAAAGDIDGDGDPDLLVGNYGAANQLMRNDQESGHHWLAVRLRLQGSYPENLVSNPLAVGARVRIVSGGVQQIREIGANRGMWSQNPIEAHFGLADNDQVDLLEVRWPWGETTTHPVTSVNQVITIEGPAISATVEDELVLSNFRLYECVPNPFNPMTTIRYDLPKAGRVRLSIYDIQGRLIRVLVDEGSQGPGRHEAVWMGRDKSGHVVSAGVYFYRIETGQFAQTKRMTLLK